MVGGGIAGLLATRVLSANFAEVMVVDKDHLSIDANPRRGAPQGRHGHNLLMRGALIMERLFPGLGDELVGRGAMRVPTEKVAWNHSGGWRSMPTGTRSSLSVSRPLLESTILRRLQQFPNVIFQSGLQALEPVLGPAGGVGGVSVRAVDGDRTISEIGADLVVYAAGRGSILIDWLEASGYAPPKCERLVSPVCYASALFERHLDDQPWQILLIGGAPRLRSGVAIPIEGERWLVSLGAMFDERGPIDHDQFRAFAATLEVPDLHEMLCRVRPASDVARMRFPYSERHRYENLVRLPAGLVAMGDAVCRFNPLLGQGMTVAAIEAETMGALLASRSASCPMEADFPNLWYRAIAPIINQAWMSVASEHYRYEQCASERPWHLTLADWYLRRLDRATYRDPEVTDALLDFTSFMSQPKKLFSPRVMGKVLLS